MPHPARPGDDGAIADDNERGRGGQAFFTNAFEAAVPIPGDPDFADVQSLELRSGRYVATAVAVLASSGTALHPVDCLWRLDGVVVSPLSRSQIGGDGNNFVSLPLALGIRLEERGVLSVACRADVADIVVSQESLLWALRVDRLEIQP